MIKALVLVLLTGLLLTACDQQALEVGAINLCGYPIETGVDDMAGTSRSFVRLRENTATYVGSSVIDPVELHFSVRFDDLAAEREFVISRDERLGLPTDHVRDLDVVVPIVGDRCPPFLL